MKSFNVHLRDGRTVAVEATGYTHDSNQYVFSRDDAELQFFVDSEVIGVSEQQPLRSVNLFPPPGDSDPRLRGFDAGG